MLADSKKPPSNSSPLLIDVYLHDLRFPRQGAVFLCARNHDGKCVQRTNQGSPARWTMTS
jgi:hypothetical protein